MVYSYTDTSGASIVEGRAFVVHEGRVYTLAFADLAGNFDGSVPTFNSVMESFRLHETARPATKPGAGFGAFTSSTQSPSESNASNQRDRSNQPVQPEQPVSVPAEPAPTTAAPTTSEPETTQYTSPDGHFRFTPPSAWELWEEQSTARGDTIEPWNTLFNWPGRPMTKALFIWEYFDEWEQKGQQYEVVLAVIEKIPGSQSQAIETLKNQLTGSLSHIYAPSTTRVRIGTQPGMAIQIAPRLGMVEPWSEGPAWFKSVTFYSFKQGDTLFVWALPSEMTEAPEVKAAVESFEWIRR